MARSSTACVDNLHVDDARRVLAWADAIAERATHRLTLYGGKPMEKLIGKVAAVTGGAAGIGEVTVRCPQLWPPEAHVRP